MKIKSSILVTSLFFITGQMFAMEPQPPAEPADGCLPYTTTRNDLRITYYSLNTRYLEIFRSIEKDPTCDQNNLEQLRLLLIEVRTMLADRNLSNDEIEQLELLSQQINGLINGLSDADAATSVRDDAVAT